MSLIIPANSASAAGGYVVDNSCRFESGSSDYLKLELQQVLAIKNFYFFTWVKRITLGNTENIYLKLHEWRPNNLFWFYK
jgi:hypothetical protein